ncbi:glycosyltransferase [Pseudodesulfovibrio thermohalotolerans]|uniref:CgeB family protein n=1 Tax=Pseudodesulfovibrio thermohalotolerans TaxID=2880651 RepID=UPI002441ACCA|nr:glycosyltransferase [Pseudodesulfovibrio thermohalotolerans]WFS60924.1 glycosyltransferase [Pseudodesulfovibrio thermohalotolerans]
METLRILVILPLYGGSLPIGRYAASALKQDGHLIEVFEAPAFYPAYTALSDLKVTTDRLDYLQNSFLNVVSQSILAKVETFQPDLVLAMAQAPLNQQALKRLRRDGVATAMWFVEDYNLFTYWKAFAPLYDVFAVIQKGAFFEDLAAIGQPNALYLPLAAQPDFHRPMDLSPVERRKFGSEVSFMGAGYPNRRKAFRELVNFDFKIWGTEWEGDHVLEPLVQLKGARVTPEECVKIFNATKINLNLHSSIQADELVTFGDFVNPRTFELAACGAFQLVDRRTLMPEAFAENELATFSSMDELVENIEYFSSRPEERQAYADRGRARVLKDHTYAQRMNSLLRFTAERIPGWPKPRDASPIFGVDYPPELKRNILDLLSRLGLPEDVSFEDLVWAVRQQQGKLNDLDTSILFLDEWRKLYKKKS